MILAIDFDGTIVEHKYPENWGSNTQFIQGIKTTSGRWAHPDFYGLFAQENFWQKQCDIANKMDWNFMPLTAIAPTKPTIRNLAVKFMQIFTSMIEIFLAYPTGTQFTIC